MQKLQSNFDELDRALKSFSELKKIEIPSLSVYKYKEDIDLLFNFDIDKMAGEVAENIKNHISNIGRKWIEDGKKIFKQQNLSNCPFCMQDINNKILDNYNIFFNEAINKFGNSTKDIYKKINDNISFLGSSKEDILSNFDKYKTFINEDFEDNKNKLVLHIDKIIKNIDEINRLINERKGVNNKEEYLKLHGNIKNSSQEVSTVLSLADAVLKNKKQQEDKLNNIKNELKNTKIIKAKKESFDLQIDNKATTQDIEKLETEVKSLESKLKENHNEISKLQKESRPDIKVINNYLKVLNLTKYSIDEDYKITLSQKIVNSENLKMILSEGEKTTLAFAYFLARLKLFYDKNTLKNLVIIIDDPISSLDEDRIYTTSYLVSKINQEIAGEGLKDNKDKAQIFILTHSYSFMTNIIRIIGKHASYFQLIRNNQELNIESKTEVAGYFDTFFLLLFSDVYKLAKESNIVENYETALTNGNKIRNLLESFMKTNFISEFIKKEYKQQSTFDDTTITSVVNKIMTSNTAHQFSSNYFSDIECDIADINDLKFKLGRVVKGLHMDSHGSIVDFYSQHKISLLEAQNFAKIAINVMLSLNPNQVHFYIDAVNNKD